ncbi:MAG: beta-propeller fold lactonase family protein [Planctomycetia bacterium]|nr:beta-propeller fold lactonase family protein [Planctomycetia bacterium]
MLPALRRCCLSLFALLLVCGAWADDKGDQPAPQTPGPSDSGFVLPNGWRLTPAGEHVPLSDLPLSIRTSPDGNFAFVATSGYNAHELTVVELAAQQKVAAETVPQSWFGLAADAAGGRLWWSGGGGGVLHVFTWKEGKLAAGLPIPPLAADPEKNEPEKKEPDKKDAQTSAVPPGFRTGVCFDARTQSLFALTILAKGDSRSFAWGDAPNEKSSGGVISRISLGDEAAERSAPCGKRPYDVALARNGLLYVSDWADRAVLVVDPESLRTIGRIPVGEHPNQLALHPKDDRLFVACASSNAVSVIDTRRGTVQETIHTALFPLAPEGSTPDALCISPNGETLYVANADNNCIAVLDVSAPRRSQVKGFIPTGWYPTAVAVTPNGKQLLVGVGKGNQTRANKPDEEKLKTARDKPVGEGGYRAIPFPYIGTTLSGSLSIVAIPDDKELAAYTDQVYRNCPYSDKLLTAAPSSRKTAIPTNVGDPSPIKHVIYIIKENRTYDQVLSDLPRGNGDPSLLMFGEEVTPNHHKLATEFVLLDNLYCNGHVSADGHPWSTMAYNTDYIARNWALTYSKRQGIHDDDEGNLTTAPSGYIWDACKRHGLAYRSYGEYGGRVSQPDGTFRMEGRVPGLVGHMSPRYGLPKATGQKVRDTDRVEVFLEEFREYEKNGDLPRFIVMSLGENHTEGTRPGSPTPQACVASNDLALGRLVEAVSQSKYWPKTAIFVIEDDAQNGPDHVDAHRTVGLVISPYVRRKHLDSTQYSTVGMLRTMELILGLPPLSQFDAAATPMYESFTETPDLAAYKHEPARINLNAINEATAYGAERSSKMDFTEYDKIDDFELNEILWRALKGKDAPLPPAVRRAIAYRNVEPPKVGK